MKVGGGTPGGSGIGHGPKEVPDANLDEVEVRVVNEDAEDTTISVPPPAYTSDTDAERPRPRTLSGIFRARRNVAKLVVAHPVCSIRSAMHRSLLADGHDVVEMGSGSDVIDYLTMEVLTGHSAPDLIITSIELPGWDGFQLMSAIHGTAWDTPVALLLDGSESVSHLSCMRRGANCILEWPMDADALCNAVRKTLHLPESRITRYLHH